MKVDPERPEPEAIARAAQLLRGGAVAAFPTETFYGLGANAFDVAAWERIIEMKGREAGKALPLIVADFGQLECLCDEPPATLAPLAAKFWPGPLTLVIPTRAGLQGALAGLATVAVRVSGLALARELTRAAGFPLTATSANLSRSPPARTADQVEATLGFGIDLLIDGGQARGESPSTIVDLSGPVPRLLRNGAVSFQEVLRVIG